LSLNSSDFCSTLYVKLEGNDIDLGVGGVGGVERKPKRIFENKQDKG